MNMIRRWILGLVIRYYLNDLESLNDSPDLTEAQRDSALQDVFNSEFLRKLLNIRVENLMRRSLGASTMEEGAIFKGQILLARWLVKSSEALNDRIEDPN